jgi:C4-dicarboxylate-specific signal transduction histidine kinase
LEQVLVNLLRNAFEAMSDNPPEDRHVKITVVSTGARIEVAVEDQGGGILPEHHDRVFEPFFTTKSTGVGIGLTICRSIVEDHGGRMWVESSRPRGAMFCFTLPLGSASNVAVSNGLDRR